MPAPSLSHRSSPALRTATLVSLVRDMKSVPVKGLWIIVVICPYCGEMNEHGCEADEKPAIDKGTTRSCHKKCPAGTSYLLPLPPQ